MERSLIVVPGSARWWLLSLTPLLFYDKVHVFSSDAERISRQGGLSSFHERAARMLEMLLHAADESTITVQRTVPAGSGGRSIDDQAKLTTELLLSEASKDDLSNLPLVRPHELKRCMINAYDHWIRYNHQKVSVLSKGESLANTLEADKLPLAGELAGKVARTRDQDIPELLSNDTSLKKVLNELVRNASMISELATDDRMAVHDTLIEEFLPMVEIVERVRLYRDLPSVARARLNQPMLWRMYDCRLNKIKATRTERVDIAEALARAMTERKRLAALRRRLAELDGLLEDAGARADSDRYLKELRSFVAEVSRTARRIDTLGTWAMWGSGHNCPVKILRGVGK